MTQPALATAWVQIMPSFDGMQQKMRSELGAAAAASGNTASARLRTSMTSGAGKAGQDAGKRFGGEFQGELKRSLSSAAIGAALGAGAALFVKDAVTAASGLNEEISKSEVVLGDASAAIIAFTQDAAQSLGQSRSAALQAANQFAVFGKSAGLTGQDLAAFSTTLVQLAADLGSFNNVDPEEAALALGAALRGEMEPARRLGLLLDDATLRQEAWRQGMIATTSQALTPQQKVLAAYQVILKQSADAQGDFARTSDGMANQQRILAASLEDAKVALGQALLPAAQAVVGVLTPLVQGFTGLSAPVRNAALAMTALAVATKLAPGPMNALGTSLTGIVKAVKGLPTVVSSLGTAWRYAGQEAQRAHGPTATLTQRFQAFSTTLGGFGPAVGRFKSAMSGLLGAIGGPWGAALIGATLLISKFGEAHAVTAQQVQELTDTLDAQTGAVTADTLQRLNRTLRETVDPEMEQRLQSYGFSFQRMAEMIANNDIQGMRDYIQQMMRLAAAAGDNDAVNEFLDMLLEGERQAANTADAVNAMNDQINASRDAAAAAEPRVGLLARTVATLSQHLKSAAGSSQETTVGLINLRDIGGYASQVMLGLAEATERYDFAAARAAETLARDNFLDAQREAAEQFLPAVEQARRAVERAQQALADGPQWGAVWYENRQALVEARAWLAREERTLRDQRQEAARQEAADAEARRQQAADDARRAREQARADAQAAIEQLRQQARAMADAVRDDAIGNITDTPASAAAIAEGLRRRTEQITAFAENLGRLAERGFPRYFLEQIVSAGVTDGAAIAASLAGASGADFRAVLAAAQQEAAAATRLAGQTTGYFTSPVAAAGAAQAPQTALGAVQVPEVRVYIGDRELTDIVKVTVNGETSVARQRARAGSRW